MRAYIAKRLLLLIPTWILVSVAIFVLMRLVPGDYAFARLLAGETGVAREEAVQALRHKLGLDRPWHEQYLDWVGGIVLRGDLGTSYETGRPVMQEILRRLPVTIELAVGTVLVSLFIALPTGIISAIRQETLADYGARLLGLAGLSVPGFWIGTMLIVLPAVWWRYSAPLGYVSPLEDPLHNLRQFAFPCLALGAAFAARSMRMTRSQMLEVLRQDYIRTAWAKGLRERVVLYRHALKNAMIPVITQIGMDFGFLLGRTVIIESVFVLPGVGSMTVAAVLQRDYTQVQGNILFYATLFILVNLVVDIAYAWFDPRIRYG